MRCVGPAFTLLLGIHCVSALLNECTTSDQCQCTNTSKGYQFQCPSSKRDSVVIRTNRDEMVLTCLTKGYNFLQTLPNYTAGEIERFELHSCLLPQDGFVNVLKRFGIENLGKMVLEEVVSVKNDPVTKDLFQGLSSLQTLDISYLGSTLEIDVFDNLPNLTILKLENNNITDISGMFRSLQYLEVLYLSGNSLADIPNGTFQNLSELQQLHLSNTNLTRIKKGYFSGLHNLKSLELSQNYIQFIDHDAFSDLSKLAEISLRENQLGHISSNIFRQNKNLFRIRMEYNVNVTLDDWAFANLKMLSNLNLAQSRLQNIPVHVFEGSENIEIIKMQNNFLQHLPEAVFSGLKHLNELDLTGNYISSIPDELLYPLVNLKILRLGGNLISGLNEKVFRNSNNLRRLYINNNKITTISEDAFSETQNLIFMDISDNLYDMENGFACSNLGELILRGNHIKSFPSSIMDLRHLTNVNLSYNDITVIRVSEILAKKMTIDLSHNKIFKVDFEMAEYAAKRNVDGNKASPSITTLLLNNNPMACDDCDIYQMVRYIRNEMDSAVKMTVELRLGDDRCASPDKLQDIKLKDLQPQDIRCPVYMFKCNSSSDCQCFYRPFDLTVVIDCSYKNLTECPSIEVERDKMVEMNLIGNKIRHGPDSSLGYDNVINILLSNNSIEQFKWVPPRTKILKLDGNQLQQLDHDVLKMLEPTSNLTLSHNPWTCDCSAFELQNFIRAKFGKESRDIVCKEDNELLIEKKHLCKPISNLIMLVIIPILLFIALTAVITTLFFCYQEEIKISISQWDWWPDNWWPHTVEDKDKKFDVFLSYSHKDEDFVHQNLLPVLEEGPYPYDICIHERDWIAGEFIINQIADSVNDSRRTLVVLSNDFLESVWGKMEFRAAHTKAINEGRARVIVIKYGELDEEKLDEEMRMYLKTNTYVEWGDPWFWRKLKYALPHSRFRNKNKDQKHANMMLKIDDKFGSACPPPARFEGAPPVAGLDSAMLKNGALGCKRSKDLDAAPSEKPLVIPIERV